MFELSPARKLTRKLHFTPPRLDDSSDVTSMLVALMARGHFIFDPYDLEERVRVMLNMPNSHGARLAAARLLHESGQVRKRHGLYEVMMMT